VWFLFLPEFGSSSMIPSFADMPGSKLRSRREEYQPNVLLPRISDKFS